MSREVVVGTNLSPSRRAPYGAVKDQLVSLSLEIEVRHKTGHEAAEGESCGDQRAKPRRCVDSRGATAVVPRHQHIALDEVPSEVIHNTPPITGIVLFALTKPNCTLG